MTRRERLERRLEKREQWAQKRRTEAAQAFDRAHRATADIPMGQPILVGHHSECRHRAALSRADRAMRRGLEASDMATHHTSKAGGLERALETSIFSDDPDAIGSLKEKITTLEATRAHYKAVNAAWRKAGKPSHRPSDPSDESVAAHRTIWKTIQEASSMDNAELLKVLKRISLTPYQPQPYPGYALTNIGGRITQAKARIADIQRREKRTATAEAAGGVSIEGDGDYVSVTFAEKPDRAILNALKDADFHWSDGSWHGKRDKLPASVAEELRNP